MDKPYFLTQENAILLEECEHAIGSHAGLYLVHGASGIGKTRLLQVLARERIDARVRWLDLADGDEDDGDLVDSSARIETVFANANPGDVIVVDHFERALKKSRHQLFLSWSTEGIDKHLGLVIGGHVDSIGELRQLAQHYQVRMEPFAMQPFSTEAMAWQSRSTLPSWMPATLMRPERTA